MDSLVMSKERVAQRSLWLLTPYGARNLACVRGSSALQLQSLSTDYGTEHGALRAKAAIRDAAAMTSAREA